MVNWDDRNRWVQTYTVKKYPAQLSLTVLMNILGGAQSAIFTAFIQRQPAAWRLNFFIEYVAVLYAVSAYNYSFFILRTLN